LNYLFLKSHDIHHKLVTLWLSGHAHHTTLPRVG